MGVSTSVGICPNKEEDPRSAFAIARCEGVSYSFFLLLRYFALTIHISLIQKSVGSTFWAYSTKRKAWHGAIKNIRILGTSKLATKCNKFVFSAKVAKNYVSHLCFIAKQLKTICSTSTPIYWGRIIAIASLELRQWIIRLWKWRHGHNLEKARKRTRLS